MQMKSFLNYSTIMTDCTEQPITEFVMIHRGISNYFIRLPIHRRKDNSRGICLQATTKIKLKSALKYLYSTLQTDTDIELKVRPVLNDQNFDTLPGSIYCDAIEDILRELGYLPN